jgi:hypothetical protein
LLRGPPFAWLLLLLSIGSLTLVHACSFFNRFPSRDFLTRIVHINCVLLICKKKEEK